MFLSLSNFNFRVQTKPVLSYIIRENIKNQVMGREVTVNIERKTPKYSELEIKKTEDIIRMLPSWRKTLTILDDRVINLIEPVIQKSFKGYDVWIEYPIDLFNQTPEELISFDVDDYAFNSERRIFPIILSTKSKDVKIAYLSFKELNGEEDGKIGFETSFIIEKLPKKLRHIDVRKHIQTIKMDFDDEDMMVIMDDIFEWKKYNSVGDDIIDDLLNKHIYEKFPFLERIYDLERKEAVMTFYQLLNITKMFRERMAYLKQTIEKWVKDEYNREVSAEIINYGVIIDVELSSEDHVFDVAYLLKVCDGKGTFYYGRKGEEVSEELKANLDKISNYLGDLLAEEVEGVCMLCSYTKDLKSILQDKGVVFREDDEDDDDIELEDDEEVSDDSDDTPQDIEIIAGRLPAEIADPEKNLYFDYSMNIDNFEGLMNNTEEYIRRYPWVNEITGYDELS